MSNPAAKKDDRVDRRTLIKRALTASGAAYVAPLILASARPASAQVVSGSCGGPECDDTGCGPDDDCACINLLGGGQACVEPVCTFIACDANADCGAGGVCMSSDCCDEGEPTCVFLCGEDLPNGQLSAPQSQSVGTQSGWRRPSR